MNKNIYKIKDLRFRGKFWDIEDHLIGKNFRRINEDRWFDQQQDLLLWMANTDYGRDLLCLSKHYPRITEFSKRHIACFVDIKKEGKLYKVTKMSDFRVGAKWANVIRSRWQEFQEYAYEYYRLKEPVLRKYPVLFPVVPQPYFSYTVTTFFPDPNPETTSVDGRVYRAPSPVELWADIRAGAGTTAEDTGTNNAQPGLDADGNPNTDKYAYLARSFELFDTAAIDDAETVDSATFSLNVTAKNDALGGNGSIRMVTTGPASNTGLVTGDFTTTGSVAQGTDKTISGITTGAYAEWTLNATGVSNITKTGVTKFGARLVRDADNVTPTWAASASENILIDLADIAGTTTDPKLVVTSTVPVVGLPSMMMMGVGG